MPAAARSWQRLMEVFSAAVEVAPGAERDAYLAQRLDDDPALLAEAIAMLRAHEEGEPLEIEKAATRYGQRSIGRARRELPAWCA
jgi:hypothetical protein